MLKFQIKLGKANKCKKKYLAIGETTEQLHSCTGKNSNS